VATGLNGELVWLPHVDYNIARVLTVGSAPHDRLWNAARQLGELAVRCQLNIHDVLRPAVQPGARIDYAYPVEKINLHNRATGPSPLAIQLRPGGRVIQGEITVGPMVEGYDGRLMDVQFLKYDGRMPLDPNRRADLRVYLTTGEDARPRAIPLHRVRLPWDTVQPAKPAAVAAAVPEIAGGSWARGRAVFFDSTTGCARCHAIHGRGGTIGPDLVRMTYKVKVRYVGEGNKRTAEKYDGWRIFSYLLPYQVTDVHVEKTDFAKVVCPGETIIWDAGKGLKVGEERSVTLTARKVTD
jgi:hypothetical protein